MAEAHSAVAFSFTVTHDGFNIHVSREALKAVYFSGLRSWRKRQIRFINRFHSGVYPAKFSSLGMVFMAILVTSYFEKDLTFGLYGKIHDLLFLKETAISWWIMTIFISSALLWIAIVLMIRYVLKLLLSYHGFLFEPFGKLSFKTKAWFALVKLLGGKNPKLYSYQASLPRLPVPSLKDTINRYLASVRPILNDHDYNEAKSLSQEFLDTIGSRLQRYLIVKSWWSSNYVTDWWEQFVYLSGRDPIMVNSNYYGMGNSDFVASNVQISRAAGFVFSILTRRSELDHEKMKPLMINNVVPLCSSQYERVFNTCRIPGIQCDQIKHWNDSRHIVVHHKGRWFKVYCYKNGKLLKPKDFEKVFETILHDHSLSCKGEEHLAALTAGGRIPWAEARENFFSSGMNQKSLESIEKAAFVLALDENDHDIHYENPKNIAENGKLLLHGNCCDRWFDKSFNIVVFKSGRFGFNAEHSWGDAPIMCHILEDALAYEAFNIPYEKNGVLPGTSTLKPLPPERLQWSLSNECLQVIENSYQVARSLADDLHLSVLPFRHFGKGLIKTFKMSPDAFLQLALQLAYRRDKKTFALTYEASMTRLFRDGRTETVRSCTREMVAFIRSMDNPNSTDEERLELMKETVQKHVTLYKEAMDGKGIDRHLFCLYVVSKFLNIESPFLQKVLNEKWRLSTSQTDMHQTRKLKKELGMSPLGGGFGPVADDGYGVSYIISHDDGFMFHISSKYSSKETDSERFARNLERSMLDLSKLCGGVKNGIPH